MPPKPPPKPPTPPTKPNSPDLTKPDTPGGQSPKGQPPAGQPPKGTNQPGNPGAKDTEGPRFDPPDLPSAPKPGNPFSSAPEGTTPSTPSTPYMPSIASSSKPPWRPPAPAAPGAKTVTTPQSLKTAATRMDAASKRIVDAQNTLQKEATGAGPFGNDRYSAGLKNQYETIVSTHQRGTTNASTLVTKTGTGLRKNTQRTINNDNDQANNIQKIPTGKPNDAKNPSGQAPQTQTGGGPGKGGGGGKKPPAKPTNSSTPDPNDPAKKKRPPREKSKYAGNTPEGRSKWRNPDPKKSEWYDLPPRAGDRGAGRPQSQVPVGGNKLSQAIIKERIRRHEAESHSSTKVRRTGFSKDVNFVAYRVVDRDGNVQIRVGASGDTGPYRHSERVVGDPALHAGDKVLEIHSERDYCGPTRGANCNAWTQHYFPDAKRTYNYEYVDWSNPADKALQKAAQDRGNAAVANHVAELERLYREGRIPRDWYM